MIGIAQNDVIAIQAAFSRYVSDINYIHAHTQQFNSLVTSKGRLLCKNDVLRKFAIALVCLCVVCTQIPAVEPGFTKGEADCGEHVEREPVRESGYAAPRGPWAESLVGVRGRSTLKLKSFCTLIQKRGWKLTFY